MSANPTPFRVAIVPGVNPGKWTKAWSERRQTPIEVTPIDVADQRAVLTDGRADVAFIRLPIDRDDLSVIRLYEEVTVVVVPSEHPISLYDSVTLGDLEGETVRHEPLEDAIDLVVAGAGILVVPFSLARQHTRQRPRRPAGDGCYRDRSRGRLVERRHDGRHRRVHRHRARPRAEQFAREPLICAQVVPFTDFDIRS